MGRTDARAWRNRPQHSGGEDVPPDGEEAREQRRATSMPVVWLGLGLAVIVAFTAILLMHFGVHHMAAEASRPPAPSLPDGPRPDSSSGAPK